MKTFQRKFMERLAMREVTRFADWDHPDMFVQYNRLHQNSKISKRIYSVDIARNASVCRGYPGMVHLIDVVKQGRLVNNQVGMIKYLDRKVGGRRR